MRGHVAPFFLTVSCGGAEFTRVGDGGRDGGGGGGGRSGWGSRGDAGRVEGLRGIPR